MESLFPKLVQLAISVILIVSVVRSSMIYIKGEKLNKEFKSLIIVLLFLGAAPSLTAAVPDIGESLVKPVVSIASYFSDTISSDLQTSVKQ